MPEAPALLELDRVGCRLGGREILNGVSFSLQRGDVLALLGVNGAGKSTTLSIIAGAWLPDSGQVRIEGRDTREAGSGVRNRIGWVPENVPLWPELTVAEALDACGRLRGLDRRAGKAAAERELARLDLGDLAHRLCGQLSLGQKRRVGLAQALLHEPDLLVLDEPGNGLDPVQGEQLRRLVGELSSGRAIVLSSHDLPEVEAMCQRVVILHAGCVRHDLPLPPPGRLRALFDASARPVGEAVA